MEFLERSGQVLDRGEQIRIQVENREIREERQLAIELAHMLSRENQMLEDFANVLLVANEIRVSVLHDFVHKEFRVG